MFNRLKSVIIGKTKKSRNTNDNRVKLIQAYIEDKLICDSYPVELIIEPTNYCNLKCIMCPRDKMKRKIGMMDFDLFEKIINESKDQVEFIYLHLFGESLFNKDIFKMVEYAENAGIKVGLSTNVTALTEKNTRNLLNTKLHLLVLSLDNPSKDTYDKVRIGGNFEHIEKNIAFFLNELENVHNRPKVVVQMIDFKYTNNEIDLFKSKFSKYPDIHIKIKDFSNWAQQVDDINNLSTDEIPISNSKCFEPWRALTIYWDGTVVPCCNDFDGAYILGNVKHSTIKSIWNDERMQELRKNHNVNKSSVDLCTFCPTNVFTYEECCKPTSPFYPYEREIEYYCDV